ncbi:hypothetical protein B0T26DRAFT_532169 [Lasiosphaeria miniovina]|uniref:Uncharacterized protein n=1 Tax=Lasiosphaeria miniovina TaxID=1954250 RepID=A0AA40DHR3_9PEZI|nr:uncharacterized protein B0T26DRAFT_532169 [Lasiosphaeria miniovina]KAK0701811.1 hypothetical protein B0T26DRAFT_532169 [Lasiosphaeria miniovina]
MTSMLPRGPSPRLGAGWRSAITLPYVAFLFLAAGTSNNTHSRVGKRYMHRSSRVEYQYKTCARECRLSRKIIVEAGLRWKLGKWRLPRRHIVPRLCRCRDIA